MVHLALPVGHFRHYWMIVTAYRLLVTGNL